MATPAINRIMGELNQRFPGLRMQVSSCRKIARSSSWSQHAFDNAVDIFASRNTLDMVAAYAKSNKARLSINNILWRVRDHYDHVHLDAHPKGIGIPPCAGGRGGWAADTGGDRPESVEGGPTDVEEPVKGPGLSELLGIPWLSAAVPNRAEQAVVDAAGTAVGFGLGIGGLLLAIIAGLAVLLFARSVAKVGRTR